MTKREILTQLVAADIDSYSKMYNDAGGDMGIGWYETLADKIIDATPEDKFMEMPVIGKVTHLD